MPNRQKADMHSACIMSPQTSRNSDLSPGVHSRYNFVIAIILILEFSARFPPRQEVALQCPDTMTVVFLIGLPFGVLGATYM
ncbi:hypothetical protein V8C34DRAFT_299116 [Trichoderma compactum]